MASVERHPISSPSASLAQRRPTWPSDASLSEAELMGRCLQLRRKLAGISQVWHSGRLDRLAEALHSLENEVQRRGLAAR